MEELCPSGPSGSNYANSVKRTVGDDKEKRTLSAAIAFCTHCFVFASVVTSHALTYGSKYVATSNEVVRLEENIRRVTNERLKERTNLGQNELNISINVVVLRYNEKISSIGTSGVSPFREPSQIRCLELSRSVRNRGIWLSITSATRSNCLEENGKEYSVSKERRKMNDEQHTLITARGTSYPITLPSSPAHPSYTKVATPDSHQVPNAVHYSSPYIDVLQ